MARPMKIRRKLPKPSRAAAPLYVIGYAGEPPSPIELATWFDLEYGGPLRMKTASGQSPDLDPTQLIHAVHGPWEASFTSLLPEEDCATWRERLNWGHHSAGQVIPPSISPGKAVDVVLHAARLARGLTLLTEGTAYDLKTQAYLNPSDWKDRSLEHFVTGDHITVEQGEPAESGLERFHTSGLAKFGLDELETFSPRGLSGRPVMDRLAEAADELIRLGRNPTVGSSVPLLLSGTTVQIVRHHTVPSPHGPVPVREISWGGTESSDGP